MKSTPREQTVAIYRLTPAIAEKRIRELAAISDNIDWAVHALRRMRERSILDADVLRTLRLGIIEGQPEQTLRREWKCKMTRPIKGNREIGVVTIVMQSNRLFIKTVEWEDLT